MNKFFFVSVLLSFTVVSSNVLAHGVCGHTELHGYMENIKDELKLMSTDVKSGDNESATQHVEILISLFEKSRKTAPYSFTNEELEGDNLTKKTLQYQAAIDGVITTLKELNTALHNEDANKVRQLFGEIGSQRNAGHRTFKANC